MKPGLMELSTRVITLKEKSMDMETSNGLMVLSTRVNSKIIIFTEKATTNGMMVEPMKANGNSIRCMVLVSLLGMMVVVMRESIMMTRSKARVFSTGQMVVVTKVTGLTASNMAQESTTPVRESSSLENGRMAKESSGSMKLISRPLKTINDFFILYFQVFIQLFITNKFFHYFYYL